jgi:hypothetical protein
MLSVTLRRLNSPGVSLLIPAVLYLILLVAQLQKHDYNFSYFIQAGDVFVDSRQAPNNLLVLQNSYGYDGQFYYRLALTPFTNVKTAFGITLDSPHYRQQRIVYPLITWVFSGFLPSVVPIALTLVNYAGLCFIGWIGGKYAQSIQRHALWGVAFALYPGFILVILRDLTEITEISFILTAMTCLRLNMRNRTSLCLTFAVLAKEPALLTSMAMLIFLSKRKWLNALKFRLEFLPIILYGIWQAWLYYQWQDFGIRDLHNNVGYPFVGFLGLFRDVALLSDHWQRIWFIELCFIVVFTVFVLYSCVVGTDVICEKIAWILYFILVFSLTRSVWVEDWAFLRACSEFYLLGTMILLASRTKWCDMAILINVVCWSLLLVEVIIMR